MLQALALAFGILGLAIFACTVGLQLTRERLVEALINAKSPLSQTISDWSVGGGGFTTVFAKGVLWGELSASILLVPAARRPLHLARTLDALRTTCLTLACLLIAVVLAFRIGGLRHNTLASAVSALRTSALGAKRPQTLLRSDHLRAIRLPGRDLGKFDASN